jgi:hypothetical protein
VIAWALAKIILPPLVFGLVLSLITSLSAPNRSEASLRSTPLASFRPANTALRQDFFIPGSASNPFFIDFYQRAELEFEFGLSDPEGFQKAFIAHARERGAQLVFGKTSSTRPPLNALRLWDQHSGLHLGAYADDALATFTFSNRSPVIAGGRSWPWRAFLTIRDGPCHFSFLECAPAE